MPTSTAKTHRSLNKLLQQPQSFDISVENLTHILLEKELPQPAPAVPGEQKMAEKRDALPSVTLLTPCYLKVTTGACDLSPAVFHRTHLSSPSPYVLIMVLPADSMCSKQLMSIFHHKQANKKNISLFSSDWCGNGVLLRTLTMTTVHN